MAEKMGQHPENVKASLGSRPGAFLGAVLLVDANPPASGSPKLGRIIAWATFLCGMAVAAWLFSPILGAGFYYLDDHELVRFLRDQRSPLTISDGIKALANETEVGKTPSSARYRPSYYILRVTELYLWHLDPRKWFIARFCMVLIAIAVLFYISMDFLGPVCGILLGLVALTPLYWADTWGRSGPAEQYGTFGLALFSIGCVHFAKSTPKDRVSSWAIWFIAAGCVLAGGSKEVFLPMFVLPALCLSVRRIRLRLSRLQVVPLILALAYGLLVIFTLYSGISHNGGTTVYGQHPDANYFARVWGKFLDLAVPYIVSMVIIETLAFAIGWWRRMDRKALIALHRRFLLSGAMGLAVLAWVLVFYAADWPTLRYPYDFPGLLLAPACAGLCFYLLDRTFALSWRVAGPRIVLAAASAVAFGWYLQDTGFPARPVMAAYAERSHHYQKDLANIAQEARRHPSYPIVFSVAHPLDGEKVFATHIFLNAKGVNNPFYIIGLDLIQVAGANPHWLGAARELNQMMAGTRGFLDNRGLEEAVRSAGGAFLLHSSPNGPALPGATELPLLGL